MLAPANGDNTVYVQTGDQEVTIGRAGDHGAGSRFTPDDGGDLVAMQDRVGIRTALLMQRRPWVVMPPDATTPAQEK